MCLSRLIAVLLLLTQAQAVVILAKSSVISHALATRAFIEAQVPVLQASATKLTALEVSGVAVAATVVLLLLIKGILGGGGNGSERTVDTSTSSVLKAVTSQLGSEKPIAKVEMDLTTSANLALVPDASLKAAEKPPVVDIQFPGRSKVDSSVITLLAIAGAAMDSLKPSSERGTLQAVPKGGSGVRPQGIIKVVEGDVRRAVTKAAEQLSAVGADVSQEAKDGFDLMKEEVTSQMNKVRRHEGDPYRSSR